MSRAVSRLTALALLLLVPTLAHAADAKDCKPPAWAPPMPGFEIRRCDDRSWAQERMHTSKGDQVLEGRRSSVTYDLKDPSKNPTAAAARDFHVDAAKRAGATLEHSDGWGAVLRKGDDWYEYDHGGGNEKSTTSYTLTTLHVMPLRQDVETRAMPGALEPLADCADPAWLVKPFPGFTRSSCQGRMWDTDDLHLPSGSKSVEGRRLSVTYHLTDGVQAPVSMALQENFAAALKKSGATVLKGDRNDSGSDVIATQKTPAGEFWMIWEAGGGNDDERNSFTLTTWQIAPLEQEVVARVPPADAATAPIVASECKDPAWLVKQFSYFKLARCHDHDFDSVTIRTKDGEKKLAGRVHEEVYQLTDEKKDPVKRAVRKNYVDALEKIGAELVSKPDYFDQAVLTRKTPEGDVWYVWEHGSGNDQSTSSYSLLTLEPPVKVACKTEVYGVNFDFDKAELRPDSEPVLQSVLAIFQKDASLKAEIGGHTDDIGASAHNQTLSQQRADAVKAWLVSHGLSADRLTTHGYGDSKPLVPNKDDDSRAKNRRVELTRQDCTTK